MYKRQDEERYRREELSTRLYGYLLVPREKTLTQNRKAPTPVSETASIEAIAYDIIEAMEPETCYLIGAGTTTRGIMHLLGLKNTLIGVDLICGKKLVAADLYGDTILTYIKGKRTKLIVTVTGGQGYLFGRGNQQLTPEVIKEIGKENIIILATKAKLAALGGRPLLVDTYDEACNPVSYTHLDVYKRQGWELWRFYRHMERKSPWWTSAPKEKKKHRN